MRQVCAFIIGVRVTPSRAVNPTLPTRLQALENWLVVEVVRRCDRKSGAEGLRSDSGFTRGT